MYVCGYVRACLYYVCVIMQRTEKGEKIDDRIRSVPRTHKNKKIRPRIYIYQGRV